MITKYLLSKGADPDVINSINQTPLMIAVLNNNLTIAKLILNSSTNSIDLLD